MEARWKRQTAVDRSSYVSESPHCRGGVIPSLGTLGLRAFGPLAGQADVVGASAPRRGNRDLQEEHHAPDRTRTCDPLLRRREYLLRSTAACRSVCSTSDGPRTRSYRRQRVGGERRAQVVDEGVARGSTGVRAVRRPPSARSSRSWRRASARRTRSAPDPGPGQEPSSSHGGPNFGGGRLCSSGSPGV